MRFNCINFCTQIYPILCNIRDPAKLHMEEVRIPDMFRINPHPKLNLFTLVLVRCGMGSAKWILGFR